MGNVRYLKFTDKYEGAQEEIAGNKVYRIVKEGDSAILAGIKTPTADDHAATKKYVDDNSGGGGGGDILADGTVPFTGIETFEAGLKTNEIWSEGSASHIIEFDDVGNVTEIADPTGNVLIQLNGTTDAIDFVASHGANFTKVISETLETSDIDGTYTAQPFKIAGAASDAYAPDLTVAIPIEVNGVTYFLAIVTIA